MGHRLAAVKIPVIDVARRGRRPNLLTVPGHGLFPHADVMALGSVVESLLPGKVRGCVVEQQRRHGLLGIRSVPHRGPHIGEIGTRRYGTRFQPSGGYERRLDLRAGTDEQQVDLIGRTLRRFSRGSFRQRGNHRIQIAKLVFGEPAGFVGLGQFRHRRQRRGEVQRKLGSGGQINFRLRHLDDHGSDGPHHQLRVHVQQGQLADIQGDAIAQASRGSPALNRAPRRDRFTGVIDRGQARRERRLFAARNRHGPETELHRSGFVQDA